MKKILLIEKYSLFIHFFTFFLNKKNTYIYYYHPYQVDAYKEFTKKIKNKKIFYIDHKTEQNITYKANKIALDVLENKDYNYIINFFEKINLSKEIIIAYKKYLLQVIAYEVRLALILNLLSDKYSKRYKILILSNIKNGNFFRKIFKKNKKILFIPKFDYKKIFSMFTLFLYLPHFIITTIFNNGFSVKKTKPRYFDFGFHFNNNIYNRNENKSKNSFVTSRNDFHINEILKYNLGKVIYIQSSWNFSRNDLRKNKDEINRRKNYLGYEFNEPINLDICIKFIKYYSKSIIYFFPNAIIGKISFIEIKAIIQILRDLLLCEIFCSGYRINNFISRDDFNPIHISRTLVFNKYGLRNNGIAHSMCFETNVSVQGPYTFFDTYFTQGKFYYDDIWKKYWVSKMHKNIGPLYGHLVTEALNNKKNYDSFIKKYGSSKKICFLMNTFDSVTCPFDSEDVNLTKDKRKLLRLMELDSETLIFIVPRNIKPISKFLHSMDNYELYKKRIIVDPLFSTYELMAYCNYLITESSSSSIFEGTFNPNLSIIPINLRSKTQTVLDRYRDITTYETYEDIFDDLSKIYKNPERRPINNNEIKKILS